MNARNLIQIWVVATMLLAAPCTILADNYYDYKQTVMDYYGLKLSFPEKMVDSTVFPKDKASIFSSCFFYFADARESAPSTSGVGYPGGLFLQLDEGCYVIMEAHSLREKPRPGQFHSIDENTVKHYEPHFDSYMLNNCGLPWFHINHEPSVLNNQEVMKKIDDARSKYVLCTENTKLQKQTNSDRVCIVRLPYIDKIYCGIEYFMRDSANTADGRHCKNETLNKVWNECSLCYGVEFYRADRYIPFTMLVFINSKRGKNIEKYVERLARYIYFDPKFKI